SKHELSRFESVSPSALTRRWVNTNSSCLDNLSRLRYVKYYEFLYELLAKQYELAKVDEARDATVIQVMDQAIEPDRKSKPKRTLIVLLSTFVALFASILWAFTREAAAWAQGNPKYGSRLKRLRDNLRWG